MTIDEFLRVYPVRAPNLMWLLGAGAPAATGIPTAGGSQLAVQADSLLCRSEDFGEGLRRPLGSRDSTTLE